MAIIVSSFPKLKVLGLRDCEIPWEWFGAPYQHKVSAYLECCQGLGVDVRGFRESWLAHVPHLKRLHFTIRDLTGPGVFDCAPLFSFLSDKCRYLYYLHIHFEGRAFVRGGAFTRIPTSVEWLMLSFDEVVIENLEPQFTDNPAHDLSYWPAMTVDDREEHEARIAQNICDHLRPLVPQFCTLCILKGYPGALDYPSIDVEDSAALCAHAICKSA